MKPSLLLVFSLALALGVLSAGCATSDDGGFSSGDVTGGDSNRVRPDATIDEQAVDRSTTADSEREVTDRPDVGPEDAPVFDTGQDNGVADQAETPDTGRDDSPTTDTSELDTRPSDPGVDLGAPEVVFDLRDRAFTFAEGLIEDIDEQVSFTITRNGVSMTLTANQGVLNQTASGFGVNSDGAGDDTDGLDGSAGEERISVTFAIAVVFRGVEVSGFSGEDTAGIVIAGGSALSITERGFFDSGAVSLAAGQAVQIYWVAGNGFTLDAISVDPE